MEILGPNDVARIAFQKNSVNVEENAGEVSLKVVVVVIFVDDDEVVVFVVDIGVVAMLMIFM